MTADPMVAALVNGMLAHWDETDDLNEFSQSHPGCAMHAKTAVIDGVWTTVASSNLDWRSILWNNEIDAVILDQPFGARMEVMFQDDVAASRPINLQTWNARPLAERVQELEASLIESLL